jgi:hypothetical protein
MGTRRGLQESIGKNYKLIKPTNTTTKMYYKVHGVTNATSITPMKFCIKNDNGNKIWLSVFRFK